MYMARWLGNFFLISVIIMQIYLGLPVYEKVYLRGPLIGSEDLKITANGIAFGSIQ